MTSENRRLLLDWLAAEEREGRRLAELFSELEQKRAELAPLARFLAIKEVEETARRTVLQRAHWFRSFSWRLVGALFTFGVLGLLLFLAWGGEDAFLAAILFFAGGASFYLVVQAMASWSSHKDQKALAQVRQRCRRELEELRRELGASARS